MIELTSIIKLRRSIRKFKSDPVSREDIDQIIEAGIYAASGMNLQSSKIIAVTNPEFRKTITDENRKIGGWAEGFDPFYGAPVILIVIADKNVRTAVYDGSLTLGNMMLKAHELGLGGVWIHRAKEEFDNEFGKNLIKHLGIEGDFEGIGHLAVGYIDGENPPVLARKENRVFYID